MSYLTPKFDSFGWNNYIFNVPLDLFLYDHLLKYNYDIKYFDPIQIIYTQLYGFKEPQCAFKVLMFTESCNSHQFLWLARLFINEQAKLSTVCFSFVYGFLSVQGITRDRRWLQQQL